MKKLIVVLVMAGVVIAQPLFAATITGNCPILTIPAYSITLGVSGDDLYDQFMIALNDANAELAKYDDQDKLATGFANANMYSTNAATQQGYPNYSLFAITTGVMVGAQAPTTNVDYYTNGKIEDDIENKGDLYAGVAGSAAVNVGINAGMIIPGLYINVKFGKFDSTWVYDDDDFSFDTMIIGGGITYSLFDEAGIGVLRWRGLTIGTGLVYQTTDVSYRVDLDSQTNPFTVDPDAGGPLNNVSGIVVVDPSFDITLDMYTLSVPFEINTAIQLLWLFNINLGVGIDLVSGNADLELQSVSDATVNNIAYGGAPLPEDEYIITPGKVTIDGKTLDKKPSWARARIMTGIGLNFGAVKIDVPIIYYLKSGAAVGVTAGIIW